MLDLSLNQVLPFGAFSTSSETFAASSPGASVCAASWQPNADLQAIARPSIQEGLLLRSSWSIGASGLGADVDVADDDSVLKNPLTKG